MTHAERDAEVHRKAFGQEVDTRPDPLGRFWTDRRADGRWHARVPAYSTDNSAAWRLVERLGELGFNMWIEWKGKGRGYEGTAEVSICKVGGFDTIGHGVGTLGEAVVNAALMALTT